MTEMLPTAFKRGVPKAERNGMYGNEDLLVEAAKNAQQITAIVTFSVPKVSLDEIADERFPLVQIDHIEPLFDEKRAAAALKLRDAEYKARTGMDALDIADVED